jgi:hypothetical protein
MNYKIDYEWVPNLRTMAIAEDGREFPNLFNAAMDWMEEKAPGVLLNGELNRRQCRELWQWLGRTDKVPKRLQIFINSEDLKRIYPGIMDNGED